MNSLAKKYNIYLEYHTLYLSKQLRIDIYPTNYTSIDPDHRWLFARKRKTYKLNIDTLDVIKLFENIFGY